MLFGICKVQKGIYFSQRKYALDLLKDSEKLGSRPTKTPVDPNHKLSKRGRFAFICWHVLLICW